MIRLQSKPSRAENIDFYAGEEGIETAEKLDEWLVQNLDDLDDEEFYGGSASD